MRRNCAMLVLLLGGVAGCSDQTNPLAPSRVEAAQPRPVGTAAIEMPSHTTSRPAPHVHADHGAHCPLRPTCNNLQAMWQGGLISVKYTGECHSRRWPRFTVSFGSNPGSPADSFYILAEPDQTDVSVCGFDGPDANSCPPGSEEIGPHGEWVFVPIPRPSGD